MHFSLWTKEAGLRLQSRLKGSPTSQCPPVPAAVLGELGETEQLGQDGTAGGSAEGRKVLLLSSVHVHRPLCGFSRVSHRALGKDSFENIHKLLIGKRKGECKSRHFEVFSETILCYLF